jgi:hypothetical protein
MAVSKRVQIWIGWAGSVIAATLAVTCVTRSLSQYRMIAGYRAAAGKARVDDVSRFHLEVDGLRARLADRAEVDYVTIVPNTEIGRIDKPEHTLPMFIAQYALAPTILRWRHPPPLQQLPEPGLTLVLANFPNEISLDGYLAAHAHELRWRRRGRALVRLR